jgi:acetolactate synthase-1/2/3 large subunit
MDETVATAKALVRAAAVYGKLRRQLGVVLTALGPSAANLMLPLANACLDQEPLLPISAQIPDDFPASHTHQLLPLHDVYRSERRQRQARGRPGG